MKHELEQALAIVARQQNRDPNELLAEMLQGQLQGRAPQQRQLPPPAYQGEVIPRGQHVPIQNRPQLNLPQRYAGVHAPQSEEDLEAVLRYLEVESGPQGVFGDGGMSAGGVFGSAPVATAGHDPGADLRSAQASIMRMLPAAVQALQQAAQAPRYYQPPPPPPPPVRMMTTTTTTYYEGPPPPQYHQMQQPQYPQGQPQQLPPWWNRR